MDKFKLKYRILVLIGIFLISFTAFTAYRLKRTVVSEEVYSSTIQEARLPVVWIRMCNRNMNPMVGHIEEKSTMVPADTLTLLPADRILELSVTNSGLAISSARYELRSGNLEELIDRNDIEDMSDSEEGKVMHIQFPNLMLPDTEYRLDVVLNTQEKGDLHYYTRLKVTEDTGLAEEMLNLADDFSDRNFNYDAAKDNTTYMETDGTADDSTLAFTNLKSTFNSLAYRGLRLSKISSGDVKLCVFDGNTGEIHLSFMAERDISGGDPEYYQIDETYIMRMGTLRLYLMNYSRSIREVFQGGRTYGKRINIGINDENDIEWMSTDSSNYTYFVTNHDLWSFSTDKSALKNIYSFRSKKKNGIMETSTDYNIHMLSCDETGNLVFLVYGYMPRGEHEGETGVSFMTFNAQTNSVSETFFIPLDSTYEKIRMDINEMSYLSGGSIFYLKAGENFYSIDITSGKYILIADNLKDSTYVISKKMMKMAWQDDIDPMGSKVIHILDLDSGNKQELRSEGNMLLKPEGFIGFDLVVSLHDKDNGWYINDKLRSIPASAVEIVDDNLNVLKRYEKEGSYIGNISVHDGRVNMELLGRTTSGGFAVSGDDTIVSSTETPERKDGIDSAVSEDKGRIYYVQIADDVKRSTPDPAATTEVGETAFRIEGVSIGDGNRYEAYANGKLVKTTNAIAGAVEAAYPDMGYVIHRGQVVYNRAGTVTSRFIDDYQTKANELIELSKKGSLMDLTGMSLKEVLYYVGKGYPVLTYKNAGTPCIIYYYDREQISLYYPSTGTREYPSIDKASEYFDYTYRDFSCNFTY